MSTFTGSAEPSRLGSQKKKESDMRLSHVSSHAPPNNGRCTGRYGLLWLISFAPPSLAMTGHTVTWIHIISPSIKWTTFCFLACR